MAKLKLVVEKLDDIEESSRGLYVEKDGKFVLDVDGVEDTSGLKSALQKERLAREAKDKQVRAWERLGRSPEEIESLIAEQDKIAEERSKAEEEKAAKAGEWDKLKAQMNDKHQTELKSKDDSISNMRKSLEKHLVDAAATSAIAAEKGVADLLLPHVQRHVKVVEEDGEFVVKVVDAKGDPRVNGKGDPLTISDLVKEMKESEVYGRAFDASGHSGSGKPPTRSPSGGPGSATKSGFKTEKERAAWVDAHGFEAYKNLPD